MTISGKIKMLRELNNLSQEEMANQMQMSKNGYAKIERGETKMNLDRLQQIANILKVDIVELMEHGNSGFFSVIGENHGDYVNNIGSDALLAEIEKLKLIIQHKEELLLQKENENQLLKTLVTTLQAKSS